MNYINQKSLILSLSLLLMSGCNSPKKETFRKNPEKADNIVSENKVNKVIKGLEGVWEDPETHNLHSINRTDNNYTVSSIVNFGSDNKPVENQKVISSRWDGNELNWSYYVPSTKYTVNFRLLYVAENKLKVEWSNDDGNGYKKKGTETLVRMMD